MDLTLVRQQWRADGIFGTLFYDDGEFLSYTLEHSYSDRSRFAAKIPEGVYTCKRGIHQLANGKKSFETFEITSIPGHSGIIFHVGNFNDDSTGCVLLGLDIGTIGEQQVMTNSRGAFAKLMAIQVGVDEFTLTVKSDA